MKYKLWLVKIVGGCAIVIFIVVSRQQKQKFEIEQLKENRVKQYYAGNRKALPGPYFVKGDLHELQFEKSDLGFAANVTNSDHGDLLYSWSGDGTKQYDLVDPLGKKYKSTYNPTPVFRLRHKDGSIVEFSGATKACLSKTGKLFVVYPTNNGFRLESGGQTLIEPAIDAKGNSIAQDLKFIVAASDEALFVRRNSNGPMYAYTLAERDEQPIETPQNSTVEAPAFSTKLGAFTVATDTSDAFGAPVRQHMKLTGHSTVRLDIPTDCPNPTLTVCAESLYFVPDDAQTETIINEYRDGKYTKLPSIPNAINQFILSANSSRDFIISASVPNLDAKTKSSFPYQGRSYYVTGDHYFDLEELQAKMGFGSDPSTPNLSNVTEPFTLLENGDLTVIIGQHLYLLHRKSR